MKKEKPKYVEPLDFFPEEIRKKNKIGEFAEDNKKDETENQTSLDTDSPK